MYLHTFLTCREPCLQDKLVAIFVISSCLFFISGLGIILYDGDFSDTYDHPATTLASQIFFYFPNKQVTFLTLVSEPNVLSLKDDLPLVIRAPPL